MTLYGFSAILQVYQDAGKLQQVFLRERDRLCRNGKLLWSPALSQHSLEQLEQQQEEAMSGLAVETTDNGELDIDSVRPSISVWALTLCLNNNYLFWQDDGLTEDCREYIESAELSESSYSVGDTVYISPK